MATREVKTPGIWVRGRHPILCPTTLDVRCAKTIAGIRPAPWMSLTCPGCCDLKSDLSGSFLRDDLKTSAIRANAGPSEIDWSDPVYVYIGNKTAGPGCDGSGVGSVGVGLNMKAQPMSKYGFLGLGRFCGALKITYIAGAYNNTPTKMCWQDMQWNYETGEPLVDADGNYVYTTTEWPQTGEGMWNRITPANGYWDWWESYGIRPNLCGWAGCPLSGQLNAYNACTMYPDMRPGALCYGGYRTSWGCNEYYGLVEGPDVPWVLMSMLPGFGGPSSVLGEIDPAWNSVALEAPKRLEHLTTDAVHASAESAEAWAAGRNKTWEFDGQYLTMGIVAKPYVEQSYCLNAERQCSILYKLEKVG